MAKPQSTQAKKNQPKKTTTGKPARGRTSKPVKRIRGTFLSILIVLIGLHGLFGVYLGYVSLKQEYQAQTSWILPLLVGVAIATVIAAIGIWYWKKWGLYLYVATQVIAMVVHLVLTGSLYVVFYDAIPLMVLGYALSQNNRLSHFE